MNRPDSAYKVPTTLKDFFKNWLLFLRPFHGLSGKQLQLAAALLEVRYQLGKKITDDELLDANVLSTDVKRKIRESLGITVSNFQMTLGDLRKHGFIQNNRFNAKYIPNLKENPTNYSLLLYFPIETVEDERAGEKEI